MANPTQQAKKLGNWILRTLTPAWEAFADGVASREDDAGNLAFLQNECMIDGKFDDASIERTFERACRIIKCLRDNQDLIDAEKKRLDEVKRGYEESEEWLRSAMTSLMFARECYRVTTPLGYDVRRTRQKPAVDIRDQDSLPEAFWRIKREVDRTALRAALEAGKDVPGAFLVEKPDNIQIVTKAVKEP